jgi:hypothetical protein
VGQRAAATWSTAAPSAVLAPFLARARPTLIFVAACLFLSAVQNVRYPTGTPALYFAVPGLDLAVLFTAYALLGRFGRRVPAPVHAGLVVLFLLVRCFRAADGVTGRFLRRPFHLHLDSILVPELARLLHQTASDTLLVTGGVLLVLGLVAVAYGTHRALRYAERYLRERDHALGFSAALAVLLALSLVSAGRARKDPLYTGAFAVSGVARLVEETAIFARLPRVRADIAERIARTGATLRASPHDLARLDRVDVYLFFIEAYGETAFRSPSKAARVKPAYERFERELGARGFTLASSVLESPTAGGGSWLAHATFASGVNVTDQLAYDMLLLAKPPTLSDFFSAAGYRSVLVQPGTTRAHAEGEPWRFEQRYYAANFDYRGPALGWGRFPDQFVIDSVHRREGAARGRPRFFEYVLVTSHVPWNAEPPILDDWSRIGDGAVYHRLPTTRHAPSWLGLEQKANAYTSTIVYDLEVIRRFVAEFVTGDALVIVLGDHQPVADITEDGAGRGVPIHVLSRRRDLVEPFSRRGYSEGMLPERLPPYDGMDGFLPAFLQDFSRQAPKPASAAQKG